MSRKIGETWGTPVFRTLLRNLSNSEVNPRPFDFAQGRPCGKERDKDGHTTYFSSRVRRIQSSI